MRNHKLTQHISAAGSQFQNCVILADTLKWVSVFILESFQNINHDI